MTRAAVVAAATLVAAAASMTATAVASGPDEPPQEPRVVITSEDHTFDGEPGAVAAGRPTSLELRCGEQLCGDADVTWEVDGAAIRRGVVGATHTFTDPGRRNVTVRGLVDGRHGTWRADVDVAADRVDVAALDDPSHQVAARRADAHGLLRSCDAAGRELCVDDPGDEPCQAGDRDCLTEGDLADAAAQVRGRACDDLPAELGPLDCASSAPVTLQQLYATAGELAGAHTDCANAPRGLTGDGCAAAAGAMTAGAPLPTTRGVCEDDTWCVDGAAHANRLDAAAVLSWVRLRGELPTAEVRVTQDEGSWRLRAATPTHWPDDAPITLASEGCGDRDGTGEVAATCPDGTTVTVHAWQASPQRVTLPNVGDGGTDPRDRSEMARETGRSARKEVAVWPGRAVRWSPPSPGRVEALHDVTVADDDGPRRTGDTVDDAAALSVDPGRDRGRVELDDVTVVVRPPGGPLGAQLAAWRTWVGDHDNELDAWLARWGHHESRNPDQSK